MKVAMGPAFCRMGCKLCTVWFLEKGLRGWQDVIVGLICPCGNGIAETCLCRM